MARVAFYFDDHGFSQLDLSSPCEGNNGVGGTQYCFLMTADALVKHTQHEVVFYHYHENRFPPGVQERIVSTWQEMLELAQQDGCDVFIFKAEGASDMVKALRDTQLKCVAWAHNYLYAKELEELTSSPAIRRVVFVGREQYDRYIDHDVIGKSVFIYNMFDGERFPLRRQPETPAVTYTGSLIHAKGFHLLARVWKDVLREVPEAQLYVIGSGRLYDRSAAVGPLQVASGRYEAEFAGDLMENGRLLPSVHFLGTMGLEKLEIYQRTSVGVMNPSGRTETFGLSAVEMGACGIPVVTKAANGLFDTVLSGRTGYLVRSERQLRQKIVRLLRDRAGSQRMGVEAKAFVTAAFSPQRLVGQWDQLIADVLADAPCAYRRPAAHFTNNVKWARMVIRALRRCGIPFPPLINLECAAAGLLRRKGS